MYDRARRHFLRKVAFRDTDYSLACLDNDLSPYLDLDDESPAAPPTSDAGRATVRMKKT